MNNRLAILKIIISFCPCTFSAIIPQQKTNAEFQQFYNSGSLSNYYLLPETILLKVNKFHESSSFICNLNKNISL